MEHKEIAQSGNETSASVLQENQYRRAPEPIEPERVRRMREDLRKYDADQTLAKFANHEPERTGDGPSETSGNDEKKEYCFSTASEMYERKETRVQLAEHWEFDSPVVKQRGHF